MNAGFAPATTFGSVCSGIEAASVAWGPLGWRAAWLAEIERYPRALLAHHYPQVPNLGDMRKIPAMLRNGEIFPPDVFTGGTPCQAFSLAGLRNSLDDARGNLSLTFCEIANEIDIQRAARGLLPATIVWENVPGVLSTKDNAFGHFLAGLAGEDEPLVPPGKKWADAGCVYGPQRAVAWRVLDAQYFGLAQRRRRVFVIASARDGFDPARVLFEFEGVRRDTAPRRESGQDTAGTLASRTGAGGFPGTDEACSGYVQPVAGTLTATYGEQAGQDLMDMPGGLQVVQAFGGNNQSGPIDVATARNACASASGRMDFESETFVVQPAPTSYAIQAGALRENPDSGPDGVGVQAHIAYTLEARAEVQAVAFSCKDYGADATVELAPTMRAMGHSGSHANAGGQLAVAFRVHGEYSTAMTGNGNANVADPVDLARCLDTSGGYATNQGGNVVLQPVGATYRDAMGMAHWPDPAPCDASEDGTGRGQPIVAAPTYSICLGSDPINALELAMPITRRNGDPGTITTGMAVRRLTPRECERLQGFPDDYTLIPYGRAVRMEKLSQDWIKYLLRGGVMTLDQVCRAAADGPRYKALGNSWAVPVVRWLGGRIDAEIKRLDAASAAPAVGRSSRARKQPAMSVA